MRSLNFTSIFCITAALAFSASTNGLAPGKVQLKSAGPLAFGPDGILFVGDSIGSSIVAIDTRDTKAVSASPAVDIKGINQKVAALLGSTPEQIMINDVKVNPISKNIYLSVSRGRGPEAMPVILRVDASGKISEVALDNVSFSAAVLPNPPASNPAATRGNPRLDTITELAFVNGSVIVAGLSNEEFSSNLRSIPFPFASVGKGTSVEIYHGSHGRFETQSPVRTFVPYKIQNQEYIVAAYTCTPLVKIPVSELKAGSKLEGTTIAELGSQNRPIDMIAYSKDNHEYILMANSARGIMKLSTDHLESYKPITAQTEPAGVPYQTLADLKGVKHLTSLDSVSALMLIENAGSQDLRSLPLP
jgi:hypothetical protein